MYCTVEHIFEAPEQELQYCANLEPENPSHRLLNFRMKNVVQDLFHRWQVMTYECFNR
jgi:hypothetical protein